MKITQSQITELATALDEQFDEQTWYWDRKTGKVILYSDPMVIGVSMEEMGFEEAPHENHERYLLVDPIDPHQSFSSMALWVSSLSEGECQRSLNRALRGPRPYASFKNVLLDFPDDRKDWFQFQDCWITKKACEFIIENELGEIEKTADTD